MIENKKRWDGRNVVGLVTIGQIRWGWRVWCVWLLLISPGSAVMHIWLVEWKTDRAVVHLLRSLRANTASQSLSASDSFVAVWLDLNGRNNQIRLVMASTKSTLTGSLEPNLTRATNKPRIRVNILPSRYAGHTCDIRMAEDYSARELAVAMRCLTNYRLCKDTVLTIRYGLLGWYQWGERGGHILVFRRSCVYLDVGV